MRSIFTRGLRRHVVGPFVIVFAVAPFLSGCSTLGIATTDELTATENRLQGSNSATNARLDQLEQGSTDMQQTLTQITASLDSLNANFAEAKAWLQTMDLDTISEDAKSATQAATEAESRSRAFLAHYLEWLKAQQDLINQQITMLESKLNQTTGTLDPPDTDEGTSSDQPADEPADGGN